MTTTGPTPLFHWADYLIFALSLACTLIIGISFAIKDRWHKQSAESYLLGDRQMNIVTVGLSILASTLNAVFLVGGIAELHYQGTETVYIVLGFWLGSLVACHSFLPKFRRLDFQVTSAYEYLERRFHLIVRMTASGIFVLTMLAYLAVVLTAPSLVFAQVSHVKDIYISVLFTGVVCAIYTGFGGIKAVIWTDTVQMLILMGSLIALPIIGIQKVGGWDEAMTTFKEGRRIIFDDFDWSYWNRLSFWSLTIGQGFLQVAVMSSNQMIIQRVLTVKSIGKSVGAIYISQFFVGVLFLLLVLVGIASYAAYSFCEPLLARQIQRPDQIAPLFIMDVMGEYHGVPGLIIAGIYAAALSTVSSAINSLSAVFLEDIIKPIYERRANKKLTEFQSGWICRGLGLLFGVISIGVAMAAVLSGKHLVPLVQSTYTLLGAPLFGLFLLGFFCPCVNSIGAMVGLLSSFAMGLYFLAGFFLYKQNNIGDTPLPLTFNRTFCLASEMPNITIAMTRAPMTMAPISTMNLASDMIQTTMAAQPAPTRPIPIPTFYDLSYQWWSGIIIGVCVVMGLVTSLVVKLIQDAIKYKSKGAAADLLYSMRDPYCCCPGDIDRSQKYQDGKAEDGDQNMNMERADPRMDVDGNTRSQYQNPAFDARDV